MEILSRNGLKNKENMVLSFSQFWLVVAFISGMIFTASAVPALVTPYPLEPAGPEKETPGTYEPGFYPPYHPADYVITELAIEISSNGFVTG
jgi:hypothetical protein